MPVSARLALLCPAALLIASCASRPGSYVVEKRSYPNGGGRMEALVDDRGIAAGKYLAWYEDGTAKTLAWYEDGHLQGPKVNLRRNGTVKSIVYHSDFRKEGPHLRFDSAGRLESQVSYRQGILHGPMRMYYPNGLVMWQGEYRDGHPSGPRIALDSTGLLMRGWMRTARSDGTPIYEGKVVNGKPDSVFAIHGQDGTFILADFREGLLHGRHRFIGRDGKEDSAWVFHEGEFVRSEAVRKAARKAPPKPAPARPGTDSAGAADDD